MPRRAPSICTYPGCNALVRLGSRCELHPYAKPGKAAREAVKSDNRRRARARRADAANRIHFYDTVAWRRLRSFHLSSEPLCRACRAEGRTTAGRIADHIVPIAAGGAPLDDDNLQTLCVAHHTAKTNRERANK